VDHPNILRLLDFFEQSFFAMATSPTLCPRNKAGPFARGDADVGQPHAFSSVPVQQIVDNNYNLDIKNPNVPEEENGDPEKLLSKYRKLLVEVERKPLPPAPSPASGRKPLPPAPSPASGEGAKRGGD
jgi:hypothetical protein